MVPDGELVPELGTVLVVGAGETGGALLEVDDIEGGITAPGALFVQLGFVGGVFAMGAGAGGPGTTMLGEVGPLGGSAGNGGFSPGFST